MKPGLLHRHHWRVRYLSEPDEVEQAGLPQLDDDHVWIRQSCRCGQVKHLEIYLGEWDTDG